MPDDRARDRQPTRLKIQIDPAQAQELALAQAGVDRKLYRDAQHATGSVALRRSIHLIEQTA